MTPKRDPREDPRTGDCIHKNGSRGPVRRYVVRRHGNEVYYRSEEGGAVKNCWLTTWMDWARGCDLGDSYDDPIADVVPPTVPREEEDEVKQTRSRKRRRL